MKTQEERLQEVLTNFNNLKEEYERLLFTNSSSVTGFIRSFSNLEDKEIRKYKYLITTFNVFYPSVLDRSSRAFVELVDIKARNKKEKILALNHYREMNKDGLVSICFHKENKDQTGSIQILYKNNCLDALEYIRNKKNVPYPFIVKEPYFKSVNNPFNTDLFDVYSSFDDLKHHLE